MNILVIHNDYQQLGGETVAVDHQIELLRRKGHNVIIYRRHNNEIINFNLSQKVLFFVNTIYNLKVTKMITNILSSQKVDIVHIHNVFPLISPSVYRAIKKKNLPIVQTLHNFRFLCPNGVLYINGQICELCKFGNMLHSIPRRCYRNSYSLSMLYASTIMLHRQLGTFSLIDRYIAPSEFVALKMLESGLIKDRKKIKIIGNFLPDQPQETVAERGNYFLYLGRLSVEKGILTLIKSAIQLPDIQLKIAGDGPEYRTVEKMIKTSNARHIELLGFVTGFQKKDLISKSLAVIIPSECYETFNLSAIECMSLGVPVIHPDNGSLPYVVGKECGIAFKQGSSESLRDAIIWADNNRDKMRELGRAAQRWVRNRYTADVHYDQLIQMYRELI